VHCIDEEFVPPLPFNIQDPAGCYRKFDYIFYKFDSNIFFSIFFLASRDVAYIKATAILCIITLVTDALATVITGFGLRTQDHNLKYKFYRIAVLVMMVSLLALLVALILYPVCFAAELNLGNRPVWEFGYAYGVCWGAAIFLFGAVILLLCDKESEEIYYKERKIVHETSVRD
jgi:hypothetical protein